MSGPVSAWMGDRLGIPGVVGIKTGYVGADMTGLGTRLSKRPRANILLTENEFLKKNDVF